MKRVPAFSSPARRMAFHTLSALLLVPLVLAGGAVLHPDPAAAQAQRKPDLADRVAGTWEGAVTSDVRGSSRNGVTITVKRVGKNLVEVSSDYARVPTVQIAIMQASSAIVNVNPPHTFLVELDRDPNRLDLSIDGAALIVRR